MGVNKKATFKDDRRRSIYCSSCKRYLTDVHLGEKYKRTIDCKGCGSKVVIPPPQQGYSEEHREYGIAYGPGDSMFTADLTDEEKKNTM